MGEAVDLNNDGIRVENHVVDEPEVEAVVAEVEAVVPYGVVKVTDYEKSCKRLVGI